MHKMFGNSGVSVSDLEPRKAPEPMPYIEPPCKPKVPEVSLLVNSSVLGGNCDKVEVPRHSKHSVSEESYNAWKWRQNQDNRPMHHFKQTGSLPESSPYNTVPLKTVGSCYSDAHVLKTKHMAGNEHGLRSSTLRENWQVSNFSPSDIGTVNTHLYTPIGESTPLQGILRNSSRNVVMHDSKISHRVSYQPDQEHLQATQGNYVMNAGRTHLTEGSYTSGRNVNEAQHTEGNACSASSNNSSQTAHRNYPSSNHNVCGNQELLPENRVPLPYNHTNQLHQNCCIDSSVGNTSNQEILQRQWEFKEKQYPLHSYSSANVGIARNDVGSLKCSCCGSQNAINYRNATSGNACKHFSDSNEEDANSNTVLRNFIKPQGCYDNVSQNCCINNAADVQPHKNDIKQHGDNKISGSKTPQSIRAKELEAQPEILVALFRLVCMQNEQLQQLKEQVHKLIQKLESSTQTAKVCMQDAAIQSENTCSCYQEKVSIGIMVAENQQEVQLKTRSPEEQQQHKQLGAVMNSPCQCCPKSNPAAVDETINFNSMKLQTLHESPPSPMSSMHVDMQDYQSDEEHCGTSVRPANCCNRDPSRKEQQAEDGDRIHWTFYSNVMQQMNKLMEGREKSALNNTPEDSQKKIQRATFKELVHMGVSICDAAAAVGDQSLLFDSRLNMMALNADVGDSDPKAKINTEALQYLDEQLKQTDKNAAGNKKLDLTLFLKTSNLSFTAMRYLQQNHGLPLFTEPNEGAHQQRSPAVHDRHCCYSHDAPPSKVLDITMLKQQPKLL